MLIEEIKDHLIDKITQELNPDFILLFGSFAKGTNDTEAILILLILATSSYHLMNVLYLHQSLQN